MLRQLLISLVLIFNSGASLAASTATGPHIEVALIAEDKSISVGNTHWLGILLSPDPDWHTYWQNPGDSGEAPGINWQSNANITFGEIEWPIPEKIPVAHLVNYGYSGPTLLMVPIKLADATSRQIDITADLSWLVCKEDCIPGWATLDLSIPVSDATTPSEHQKLFEQTRERLPQPEPISGSYEINDSAIVIAADVPYRADWQLLPLRSDVSQHNAPQQWVYSNETQANAVLSKSDYFAADYAPLGFLLTDGVKGYYLSATHNNAPSAESYSLLLMILFALVGGLILNIMPCVLPVLSLKAMALAGKDGNISNANHWGYPIGILVSFWAFAALIILLKTAGSAIGWGFHLQQPLVIAALAFLFVFIALMLWDLTPSGASFAGSGQNLTQGNTFASQFFTGVLAVVVASPCTAPFMASAMGVAMLSPTIDTLLIFTALAVGFALPMTALSLSPRFASWLPKPGAWMETFKHFLAFPMLATVIWLVWVFLEQTSSLGQVWLLSGLLLFAMFIWLASKTSKVKNHLCMLLAVGIACFTSLNGATLVSNGQTAATESSFSEQKLASLRARNEVVLVNMTADWCITCKVNEQLAFSDTNIKALFSDPQTHYMVGDWTNKNPEILDFLTRYQRSGVPLYVVYAGEQYERVLPQVLTPDIVITAIKQARKEINNATTH